MAAGPWAHDFILRSVPVDGAVTYHSHLASNAGGKRLSWRRRIEAIRDIVEQRPDVVVDIRGDLGTLVAALLSRATHRADRGAWRMHRAIRRLFPRRGEGFPRELHELEESLAIAGALGIETNHRRLQLLTHPDDERHVDALLKEFGFPSRPLVALHPGASEPGKMWPAERFGALAARLAREHELRFAITGIARERPLAQEIAQRLDSPTIDLCGRLSLSQLYILYRRCALWIGNDTGPMHFAIAAQRPVVVMWGPASPHKYHPFGVPCLVVSRPADPDAARPSSTDYMAGLSVDHAWSRLSGFLAGAPILLTPAESPMRTVSM